MQAIAKGARKAASRLAGASEPLTVSAFVIASGKHTGYITQAQPISSFPGLRSDFDRIALGLAFAELASLVLPPSGPLKGAFQLAVKALTYLEAHPVPVVAAVWAELKLMELVGMLPQFDICHETHEPLMENPALIAPRAGGYVHSSLRDRFQDAYAVPAEWLIGAARTVERDAPPDKLKHAAEIFAMLHRFWVFYAEDALDARVAYLNGVTAGENRGKTTGR